MSENKRHSQTNVVINDKSRGSTHLRFSEIFSNHILQLYCWVCRWKNFLNRWTGYLAKLQARKSIAPWWSSAKAVSCDFDIVDAYNSSFSGFCSMDTVSIFSSVRPNYVMLTSPDSTFSFNDCFLNGWILRDSLSLSCQTVSLFHEHGNFWYQIFSQGSVNHDILWWCRMDNSSASAIQHLALLKLKFLKSYMQFRDTFNISMPNSAQIRRSCCCEDVAIFHVVLLKWQKSTGWSRLILQFCHFVKIRR